MLFVQKDFLHLFKVFLFNDHGDTTFFSYIRIFVNAGILLILEKLVEALRGRENVEFVLNASVTELLGEDELNGIVVGTGDLSELALGWCTYSGDQMSMYGINAGIPKTLVRYLVKYAAENLFGEELREVLLDVVETPVSPELLPTDEQGEIAQKTEDKVGPYELHDFFIYYFLRYGFTREKIRYMAIQAFEDKYDEATIDKWLSVFMRRFCTQQFKRSCMPDGPKVVAVSLSPRGDWRMPSDASCI